MADHVELISPRHLVRPRFGGGAPRGRSDRADEEREDLSGYLAAACAIAPDKIGVEVESLSIAERTILEMEMEMDAQRATGHSFDYDPLAY